MVSLRSSSGRINSPGDGHAAAPSEDWLTLPQAACELGVSVSTVRRLLRKGKLPNRIVPRRGGYAYLIHLPGNRHANDAHAHLCAGTGPESAPPLPAELERNAREAEIHRLEQQVEALSHALSRALRIRQVKLPAGIGDPAQGAEDPYARYRWLVRRRHWWPF